MKAKRYPLAPLILVVVLVYMPSLFNFFSADDWFHLRVSNIGSWREFINFFSFLKTNQSIAFYRPLSTQTFFFIFQKLFDLNSFPYHLFILLVFGVSLHLLYQVAIILLKNKRVAFLAVLVYGFSVSNFTRLYFLSAFQEGLLVLFSLLTILSYLRRKRISWLFFVLALLSKETAVVLPLVLLVLDWTRKKRDFSKLTPLVLILLPYLYLRLFKFGIVSGDTYVWNFSPLKAGNTLMWYSLWAIGSPEFLVDYIGPSLQPISRFFADYSLWWPVIVFPLMVLIVYSVYQYLQSLSLPYLFLFVISLGPVLFLPTHKFALELGLPLVWFSLLIAQILPKRRKLLISFLVLYLGYNLSMNYLTYTRHYSIGRAKVASRVYQYFKKNYPNKPTDLYFEFINDTADYGKSWGSSKQIANSTGGSELFRVLYLDRTYKVYFEDYPGKRPLLEKIPISTKMFFSEK